MASIFWNCHWIIFKFQALLFKKLWPVDVRIALANNISDKRHVNVRCSSFLVIYLNLKLSQENSYCVVRSILINEKTEI